MNKNSNDMQKDIFSLDKQEREFLLAYRMLNEEEKKRIMEEISRSLEKEN